MAVLALVAVVAGEHGGRRTATQDPLLHDDEDELPHELELSEVDFGKSCCAQANLSRGSGPAVPPRQTLDRAVRAGVVVAS